MSDSQIIALCKAVEESGDSLGAAVGLGTSTSQFQIEVAKAIHSVVIFSPASICRLPRAIGEDKRRLTPRQALTLHSRMLLLIPNPEQSS